MKILSIVWYKIFPPIYGGQKGISLFNKYLGRIIDLECICSANNDPTFEAGYKINPVLPIHKRQFLLPGVWKLISKEIRQKSISHVIVEHPYYGLAVIKARKKSNIKMIVHSHNIESIRFRELGKWWWYLLYLYEKWVHSNADLNLFKTKSDLNYAIKEFGLNADSCMIVPYGMETKSDIDFEQARKTLEQRHGISKNEKILLFAASPAYSPNRHAVRRIKEKLVPLMRAAKINNWKIIITGRNDINLSHGEFPEILLTGEIAYIENYFTAADVFINPVLTGGGIQTKTIEALFFNCNVVSFKKMTDEDLFAICPGKILVADDDNWPDFFEKVKIALKHRNPTPQLFFDQYNQESIARRVAERMRAI